MIKERSENSQRKVQGRYQKGFGAMKKVIERHNFIFCKTSESRKQKKIFWYFY